MEDTVWETGDRTGSWKSCQPLTPITVLEELALISGLAIGHAESSAGQTGCTVFLCPQGAVASVSIGGGAPATRETDLLRPEQLVDKVHAIMLTGGSAFGLAAVDGVVRWLWERAYGWPTGVTPVPIVPAAAIFDLQAPRLVWPDAALGYTACERAANTWPAEGRVGAGRGATVGKVCGIAAASAGGIGGASRRLPDDTVVGAAVVVNAFGHVIDPVTGRILAGPRLSDGSFGDTVSLLLQAVQPRTSIGSDVMSNVAANTTIGVIWTNARLDKTGCARIARVAHNGLARTIRPAHTQYDGDTLFMLSLPGDHTRTPDLTTLGVAATEVVARAVVRAVTLP